MQSENFMKINDIATREDVIEVLKTVIDPEIFVDVWTLGLIYNIDLHPETAVLKITMTFTSMGCPAGPQLVEEIRSKTAQLHGVQKSEVEVVFRPPWQPSDELKAILGLS